MVMKTMSSFTAQSITAAMSALLAVALAPLSVQAETRQTPSAERTLTLAEITNKPATFRAEVGSSGQFTWWLPAGAQQYILPISAGIVVDPARPELMRFLQKDSPWSLVELPALGLQYGNQLLVVIVPWPHYAELIVTNRLGIRFSLPKNRHDAAPAEIVALLCPPDPLEVAHAFREWRRTAAKTDAIPKPRPLTQKIADLEKANRLLGAPHFYLWGAALFSHHDIPHDQWVPFAKALSAAPPDTLGATLLKSFSKDQRDALREQAAAQWPMDYLTVGVAKAIDAALSKRQLLALGPEVSPHRSHPAQQRGICKSLLPVPQPSRFLGRRPLQVHAGCSAQCRHRARPVGPE